MYIQQIRSLVTKKINLLLANLDVVISNPNRWSNVIKRKNSNHNIPFNEMQEDLDPNYFNDFEVTRTAKDVKLLFKAIKEMYKEAIRKWTIATRGA